jgi:2'-5' RNA ligase
MRCFIACFLSPDSAQALASQRPALDGCRLVAPENLHVTLRFLGSVAAERRDDVLALAESLDGCATGASVLEVTGYPKKRRARAIVARVDADPVLGDWYQELLACWPGDREALGFDPHVTLALSRRGVAVPDLPALVGLELKLLPPAAYLSETLPDGARYAPLIPA